MQVRTFLLSWLLSDTGHFVLRTYRTLWADGVEISVIFHLNNPYYSILYLYRPRYNENASF